MEKKIVPIRINFRLSEVGAILVNYFGNKGKASIALILLGFLFLGIPSVFAEETGTKEKYSKQLLSIEKRGALNVATSPGEVVNVYKIEKKDHPKAWPATYFPSLLLNFVTRFTSGAYDVFILPAYAAATNDTTPLTRRFNLPDYVWEEE